jgi:anti-sigma factor RsiW
MDHDFIEAHELVARYVAQRLTAEEERAFEAHLVDCQRCTTEVEHDVGLREGLRALQVNQASQPRHERRLAWTGLRPPVKALQLAAAVLLVAAIGLGLGLARTSQSLNAALAERQDQQRRADAAVQTAQSLERRVADLEERSNQKTAAPATVPVLPAVVFALTAPRGAAADAAPLNRITLTDADRVIVFTVDVPPMPGGNDYMVSLRDRAGSEVWSGGPFRPSPTDALAVAIDRSLLRSGTGLFEVHHRATDGRRAVVGSFPFEITFR